MDLHLPPHLERFVREQLASGRFQTEGDIVRAALRLLEDQAAYQGLPAPRLSQTPGKTLASQGPEAGTDPAGTPLARHSPRGILADLRSSIGPDEIAQARNEMWAGFLHGTA